MDQADHSAYDYRALSLLAASDRVQHTCSFIRPNLENGILILSDRYYYSCLANLHARGYTSDSWIYEVGSYLIKPDLSLFFDIDYQTAIERVRSRPSEKDRYIDIELQKRLREKYLEIAHAVGGVIIDTSDSPDACFESIKKALKEKNIYV
jgi:dTMP kinase